MSVTLFRINVLIVHVHHDTILTINHQELHCRPIVYSCVSGRITCACRLCMAVRFWTVICMTYNLDCELSGTVLCDIVQKNPSWTLNFLGGPFVLMIVEKQEQESVRCRSATYGHFVWGKTKIINIAAMHVHILHQQIYVFA